MNTDLSIDLKAGMHRSMSLHVENLCKQAKKLGMRVAVQEPILVQSPDTLAYSIVLNHQFLSDGQMPSLPGACTVYGPWPV